MKLRLCVLSTFVTLWVISGFVGSSYALAQEQATGVLQFLDEEQLPLEVPDRATSVTSTVALSNGSDQPIENLRFFAVTQDAQNNSSSEAVTTSGNSIPALSTRSFELTIPVKDSAQARSGFLLAVGGRSGERAERPLQLKPQPAPYHDPQKVVLAALVGAILLVIFRALFMRDQPNFRLSTRMGQADWDFDKSWASTLTVLSVVLTTIAGAELLPEVLHFLPKEGYSALSLLFGVLVVVAGIVYNSMRSRNDEAVSEVTGEKSVQYQGYVGVFLVSTVLTLWAALGQMATIYFLLAELQASEALSWWLASLLQIIVVVAIVPLLFYMWNGMRWVLIDQMDRASRLSSIRTQLRQSQLLTDQEIASIEEPELPKWSLL